MTREEFDVDMAILAFEKVFQVNARRFGSPNGNYLGASDGNDGTQWNIGVKKDSGECRLGVNLEGMKYQDWPIAQFLEAEINKPSLINLAAEIPNANKIMVRFTRDAWQVTARPKIEEQYIGGHEVLLSEINASLWKNILHEAYDCLDEKKGHRARAKQVVTLSRSGQLREMAVSPHLNISIVVWKEPPFSFEDAVYQVDMVKTQLLPVYTLVERTVLKKTLTR